MAARFSYPVKVAIMLSNLRISRKLAAGFAVVITSTLVMGGVLALTLGSLSSTSVRNSVSSEIQDNIDIAIGEVSRVNLNFVDFAATGIPGGAETTRGLMEQIRSRLDTAAKKLPADLPEMDAKFEAARKAAGAWLDGYAAKQLALMQESNAQARVIELYKANAGLTSDTMTTLQAAETVVTDWSDAEDVNERAAIRTLNTTLAVGLLAALLLSVTAALVITRSITRPLGSMIAVMGKLAGGDTAIAVPALHQRDEVGDVARAVQVFKDAAIEKRRLEEQAETDQRSAEKERSRTQAERQEAADRQASVVEALAGALGRLAAGDLTCDMTEAFSPEYERLRGDFNAAVTGLREAMGTIISNTAAIRSGAGEISHAADDLSRRTEQQAASLEETAAALDQITATVKRTAEGSGHARTIVTAARDDAERSGAVVRDAVTAMGEIERSSQQISQIIGVIDEIAFQTNLLALNAGVEAARAGDAGRGFAVVASEVRALAQRSAEAAKQIKGLILASTQQVSQGVRLVGETGQALGRIVGQVGEINATIVEIASSAQEQATGLHQVNAAVNQMDQVTQQNAAMVEQSTAASHALQQEAEELVQLTGRFQVGAPSGHHAADTVPARAGNVTPLRAPARKERPTKPAVRSAVRPSRDSTARQLPSAETESWEEF